MTEAGDVLVLPMEVFEQFQLSKSSSNVFAHEIFTILTLACSGTVADKAHLLFGVFDMCVHRCCRCPCIRFVHPHTHTTPHVPCLCSRGAGSLTQADMFLLIRTVGSACQRVGLLAKVSPDADIETLAEEMCVCNRSRTTGCTVCCLTR